MSDALLIRADAGVRMGTGHVMRCLGLAQAWQDAGGQATYVMAPASAGIEQRLQAENIKVRRLAAEPGSYDDARATLEVARECDAAWIVVDGYHFDECYQSRLKNNGPRLFTLDDFGALPHYGADIVLNQDPIAAERLYCHREPHTRLLLGTEYAFLRREFRKLTRPRREPPAVARKLLVTMGGSDPDNVTEQVIRSLDFVAIEGLEAVVLVGPSNPHGPSLEAAARASNASVQLLRNPSNIPELMAGCDLAVTAGGSTIWEMAYCFVPCLAIAIAENQEPVARFLLARGACAAHDAKAERFSEELPATISRLCRDRAARAALGAALGAMIDGRGAERVCQVMRCEAAADRQLEGCQTSRGCR